jgi:uncharacterized protein YerC
LVNDPNRLAKLLSKLTDDQVREIRKRIQAGEPYSKIAPDYNVSVMTISSIKTGRRYNDVKDDAA